MRLRLQTGASVCAAGHSPAVVAPSSSHTDRAYLFFLQKTIVHTVGIELSTLRLSGDDVKRDGIIQVETETKMFRLVFSSGDQGNDENQRQSPSPNWSRMKQSFCPQTLHAVLSSSHTASAVTTDH